MSRRTRQYFSAKISNALQSDEFKSNFNLIKSIYQNDEDQFDSLIGSFPPHLIDSGVGNGKSEWTLLMIATHKSRYKFVIKLLNEYNANPNCIDKKNKKSVLTMACSNGYNKIAKELLLTQRICNINGNINTVFFNDNPLIHSVKKSNKTCVELLFNRALHSQICDINIQNQLDNNKTALYIACDRGDIEIVKLLLNYEYMKCDTNLSDNKGYTPLMKAVAKRHYEIVKLLLHKIGNGLPLNINLRNKYDHCGIMISIQIHHFKIAKLLLNYYNISTENKDDHVLYRKDYKNRSLLEQCIRYKADKRIITYIKFLLYASIHSVISDINSLKQNNIKKVASYIPHDVVQFICCCTY